MEAEKTKQLWKEKISNARQLGGIETAVLDNGPGRGTRIAWINTGTGLRYKVVIDRAMDIADAFFNQHSLSWLSHTGITSPEPFSNKGIDWLKTFGGGLLATCGLSHIGGPESDEFGDRGVHGQISNTPAEIESIIQPDLISGNLGMSISGKMRETQIFGPRLELKRTISSTLGKAVIKIQDTVTNVGNTPAPHMQLYHFNFGWPLVDEGTAIIWKGKWQSRGGKQDDEIFNEGNNFRTCSAPLESHSGSGEAAGFIDVAEDEHGKCQCGLYNSKLNLAVALKFNKAQLPWLTNWQHWGKGEYVTGLEPGTNPPIGQAKARKDGSLIFLKPGESKVYEIELALITDENLIQKFYKIA
ncbi:aldose 1-epimerase family protein [Flexithrix dorotheae]|uniref:aldose 1-epimerase family protein n=1 Tax=Flexithrix dorotheae TaxID=70993 RepID=UPI00037C33E9|nr:aldose 1-epimerase family protein [Flexithrix dorotheae]